MIRSYQITNIFPLWVRLYQHVFCKKPSLFSSSSRYRNLGLSKSECGHYACPNLVPLLLATPLVIHEKNWKCLDAQAPGLPVAAKNNFHRPHFLWTPAASPASHAIDRSVLLRVLHFYLCFRFLLIHAPGFTVTPHSYFHFILLRDFSAYLLTSKTESCDEDVEEVGVGVVEELVEKPGTTNGT